MLLAAKRGGFIFLVFVLFTGFFNSEKKFIRIFFPEGSSIVAELAVTDLERMRGLMFREHLGEDQGMLFIFDQEDKHSFWMKNMTFAIDILWLDREKRIVHIERRVPPCRKNPCPSYAPNYPALYVLELMAGMAEKKGLELYDRIDFILENLDHPSADFEIDSMNRCFSF